MPIPKSVKTPAQKRKWHKIEKAAKKHYGDAGTAVRVANAAMMKKKGRGK